MKTRHSRAHDGCQSPITRFWSHAGSFATRFLSSLGRDQRGGTAVFLAIAIIPLMAMLGLAVDTTRGYLVKSRLSSAVDAAALAGARVFSSDNRDADVQMYFTANFPPGYMGSVTEPISIVPNNTTKKLVVSAEATIPTTFMHLVGIDIIPVAASAEVIVESQNVEVALVLDITDSMEDSMGDLRAAANQLVDIVVQDDQTLFYTKVSLVPYSHAVNVGATNAPLVRGDPPGAKTITNIEKIGTTSSNRKIRITSNNHGFADGDKIFIAGVNGSSGANLDNRINNNASGTYNTIDAPLFWTVGERTANNFILKTGNGGAIDWDPTNTSNDWTGTWTNGGTISCMAYTATIRCPYLAFQRYNDNAWRVWAINNCVTERYGSNVATDAAPSTTLVGARYQPVTGADEWNLCGIPQIQPLTSDKATLHTKINALTHSGSTAGHIGIAWGWYMLSPNFSSLWPVANRPAAYKTQNLMKVAILMTDGAFNTMYRNGVLGQDSSYTGTTRINQNSHNGNPYTQALNLCAGMKTEGITIYTVGFNISSNASVTNLLSTCAKNASHAYLPDSGADLQDAFQDIAMKISKLRLTK